MVDKIAGIKPIPDQNGDGLVDRVVTNKSNEAHVEYQQFDSSYSPNDPLIHGRRVLYQGKAYRAFQQTPDTWLEDKNRKDAKVCLVPPDKKANKCKTKAARVVNKTDVKPARPLFFVLSAEWCAPCHYIYRILEGWVRKGYCQFVLVKLDNEKVKTSDIDGPPHFNKGRLPLVALLHPDGHWQEFPQYASAQFDTEEDYLLYLWNQIDVCRNASEN